MNTFQVILKAAAPKTLWLGISSVIGGCAAAAVHGSFELLPAVLCLLFAILAQATGNVMYYYHDVSHPEAKGNPLYANISANLPASLPVVLKEAVKVLGIMTATLGCAIFSLSGLWTLIIGAIILFVIVAHNTSSNSLCNTVFYPLITFLLFGPVGVIGTTLVQTHINSEYLLSSWDLYPALTMSVIVGLMAFNSHLYFSIYHKNHKLYSSHTKFYKHYRRPAIITSLILSTVIFAVVSYFAPFWMDIRYLMPFAPVPMISMALNIVCTVIAFKPRHALLAWNLSLWNIVCYNLISLIVFFYIGYPEGYLDYAEPMFPWLSATLL